MPDAAKAVGAKKPPQAPASGSVDAHRENEKELRSGRSQAGTPLAGDTDKK